MPNSLSDRSFCCQSAEVGSFIGSIGDSRVKSRLLHLEFLEGV
ncbi:MULTISPECIES: hypothetical protein [Calothrix]|nr:MULTISPECIES: hypothetical protein [Calothrix]